jgi:hypothetical protein
LNYLKPFRGCIINTLRVCLISAVGRSVRSVIKLEAANAYFQAKYCCGMGRDIADEIVELIESEGVVGLATFRHYPREKMVYGRFGRCGFAIDVVRREDGFVKTYSVLVEAEAKIGGVPVKDFSNLPGRVVYTLSVETGEGRRLERKEESYVNAADLFSRVERVRQAFYRVYNRLKEMERGGVSKVGEEVFHAVGLVSDELHLGV